ncbi:MAG: homoserine dehydrogenase [Candidatus Daviesbacteria bacterium]|nr:homoserine dehydrogenase [Candidatus Daviesbacteria bacterium]
MKSVKDKPINIGLIGFGNVGTGIVDCFLKGRFKSAGIVLKTVAVKNLSKVRDVNLPKSAKLTQDANFIIEDPEIDIVVELMGGTDLAKKYCFEALRAKKHLVTANKALLGECLPDLYDIARENKVSLSFEASVCGAIPVIQNLRDYFRLQQVTSIKGILNGTTNYILTKMEDGMDFDPALKEAQSLGIAEADHILDTGGFDTRSKLAILASLASGTHIKPESIPCRGITEVKLEDIAFARKFRKGYAVKLLASAQQYNGTWSIQVNPTLISRDNPLASIRGKLNSVTVEGDLSGPLTFTGFGASRNPTAGAVISDILHAAEHVRFHTPDFLPVLDKHPSITKPDDIQSEGYIRTELLHKPGTLASVAKLLGNSHLNIRSLLQQGEPRHIAGRPITTDIITVEKASQKQIDTALVKLTKSSKVRGTPFYMPFAE